MLLKVRFQRNWRGVRRMFYPLRYRVPNDISENEARRAIAEGAAVGEKETGRAAITIQPSGHIVGAAGMQQFVEKHVVPAFEDAIGKRIATPPAGEPVQTDRGLLPPNRRGRKKKPAPENKAIGAADEDKQSELLDGSDDMEG